MAEHFVRNSIVPRLDGSSHLAAINGDRISQETLLRHYGSPSRLLDWTLSPFVALFFSCAYDFDRDGELWRASAWAAGTRARVPPEGWQELLGWFDTPDPAALIAFVEPPQHTARSAAQQCLFSISDDPRADHKELLVGATNKTLEDHPTDWRRVHGLRRLIVPHELKHEFLDRLQQRNVHAAALFPDLEGLGRYGDHLLSLLTWKTEHHLERMSEEHREQLRAERKAPE